MRLHCNNAHIGGGDLLYRSSEEYSGAGGRGFYCPTTEGGGGFGTYFSLNSLKGWGYGAGCGFAVNLGLDGNGRGGQALVASVFAEGRLPTRNYYHLLLLKD